MDFVRVEWVYRPKRGHWVDSIFMLEQVKAWRGLIWPCRSGVLSLAKGHTFCRGGRRVWEYWSFGFVGSIGENWCFRVQLIYAMDCFGPCQETDFTFTFGRFCNFVPVLSNPSDTTHSRGLTLCSSNLLWASFRPYSKVFRPVYCFIERSHFIERLSARLNFFLP
jgi:hypothetical protein